MIGPGTGVRVYLACGVTDMRKGIAGLAVMSCIRNPPVAQCLHSGGGAGIHCPATHVYMCERGIKPLYWDG
jgi:transposase